MLGLMKSLIFVVGLTIFMASLIMAFELPTHKETLSAIGSTNALPDSLQRALSIDDFEPIPFPFSLAHCIYFKCVINGSNHLQESDSRPLSLCPVCLRKLQSSIGFTVATRYHRLKQFYSNVGFNFEQDWVTRRLKKIKDSNYGQD